MDKIIVLAIFLMIFPLKVNAQEAAVPVQNVMPETGYSDVSDKSPAFDSDCDAECQPHQTMKNLVEGRVANVACLQTCKQRKVWEKLSVSIADVAEALKKNSYKEVMVPIEYKLDELKTKVGSLEQKLDKLRPAEKEKPVIK